MPSSWWLLIVPLQQVTGIQLPQNTVHYRGGCSRTKNIVVKNVVVASYDRKYVHAAIDLSHTRNLSRPVYRMVSIDIQDLTIGAK